MDYPVLMFDSAHSYQVWRYGRDACKEEYEEAFLNFQMAHIVNKIKEPCEKFPDFYIKYFCREQKTAQYRLDIIKELCEKGQMLKDTENLCTNLEVLKAMYLSYRETKHDLQKQYQYIYFLNFYFQCVDDINNIYAESETDGFKSLLEILAGHSGTDIFIETKEKTKKTFAEIQQIFLINAEFYFSEQGIHTNYSHTGGGLIEKIYTSAKNLLDIDLNKEFSALSNSPLTDLDTFFTDYITDQFPDEIAALAELFGMDFPTLNFLFFDLPEQLYFYTGYQNFMERMRTKNFYFTFPSYVTEKRTECKDAYDLSLAVRLVDAENRNVICNDININSNTGFILTGANQGGKTTYLRSLGICTCLANNGLPVPCKNYEGNYFDHIFSHFNKAESVGYKQGRLGEEIERFEKIISGASEKSLIIANEAFASTRRLDGVEISMHFLKKMIRMNATFGIVTHFYEIFDLLEADHPGKAQSLVVMVNKENSAERLYKVMNLPPNTIAYAHDIAKMCGVTADQLVYE